MKFGFGRTPEFAFGVEEEFQLYYKDTLKPFNTKQMIKDTPFLKTEFLANMIEINTTPCLDIDMAREQLSDMRGKISDICNNLGVYCVAIGIYPFLKKEDMRINEEHAMQYASLFLEENIRKKRMYMFFCDTHTHVSMDSFKHALKCMDGVTAISSLLIAIGSNSSYLTPKKHDYDNYKLHIWNDIGKEMLKIKREKLAHTGVFERYAINELDPPVGLTQDQYIDLNSTFRVIGSWRHWIDFRPIRGTIQIRHYNQHKDLKDTLCLTSLSRGLTWALLNRNMDLQHFNFGFEEAVKFGITQKIIYDRAIELAAILEESPFFDHSMRIHLENMLKITVNRENYKSIDDPFRFTAENSINRKN